MSFVYSSDYQLIYRKKNLLEKKNFDFTITIRIGGE